MLALALCAGVAPAGAESLRDIYELALANDAQLKAEEAQYKANLETENLGLSALLPQVNANYNYTDVDRSSTDESFSVDGGIGGGLETVQTITDIDTTRDGYEVSLNQALFDLPAWFTFQSGKEFTKQAEATFAANQQNLIVRVAEAYLLVPGGIARCGKSIRAPAGANPAAFRGRADRHHGRV